MKTYQSDKAYINPQTLHLYCNTNQSLLTTPPKAFVLEFPGLGGGSCMGGCMDIGAYNHGYAAELAKEGILVAYLFPGPWSWMNRGAVRMVNLVLDAIYEAYHLTKDTSWVVTGGSMGGLGALMYCATSGRVPTACLAMCPCTHVPDCLDASPDFPRTIVRAVAEYDMPLSEGIKLISPHTYIEQMPHIPYMIVNDGADEYFPEGMTEGYVADLREHGHDVTYLCLEGCRHGEITPYAWGQMVLFMKQQCGVEA